MPGVSFCTDTLTADTLTFDTARISAWQVDVATDYNRELMTPDVSLMKIIGRYVSEFLSWLFGSRFAETYTEWVIVGLMLVILALVLWFVYRKRPELFMRNRRSRLAYNVQEDTIYGVDFEAEIASAHDRGDYREAVRLVYLQTLKWLSDGGHINWQPYKTPTEYLYEVKGDAFRMAFRELTDCFLRVRYGNFDATEELFLRMKSGQQQMQQQQQQQQSQIDHIHPQTNHLQPSEGGEQ